MARTQGSQQPLFVGYGGSKPAFRLLASREAGRKRRVGPVHRTPQRATVASTRSAPPARPLTRSAARPRVSCGSATPSTPRPWPPYASAALTGCARSRRSGAARPSTRSRSSGFVSPRGTRRSTPRRRSGGSARWTQRSPAARRHHLSRRRRCGAATKPTRSPTTSSRIRSRPGSSRRLYPRTKRSPYIYMLARPYIHILAPPDSCRAFLCTSKTSRPSACPGGAPRW